jgi:hypothetical protein
MGKKSRTKGAAGELEVVRMLGPLYPEAKRELEQYQGALGRDLSGTQPFCIQIKRQAKVSLNERISAYHEAQRDVDGEYRFPIAITRGDYEGWTVTTSLLDMLDYLSETSGLPYPRLGRAEDLYLHMEGEEWVKWVLTAERIRELVNQLDNPPGKLGAAPLRLEWTEEQSASGCQ